MYELGFTKIAGKKFLGQAVLKIFFYSPAQGTGTQLLVVSFLDQKFLYFVGNTNLELFLQQAFGQLAQFKVDDRTHALLGQGSENNDFGQTVEKLGLEALFGLVHDLAFGVLEILLFVSHGKAHGSSALKNMSSDVGGHDQDGIAKINLSTQAVSQSTVFQNLEEYLCNVGMGFFDFIKKDDSVGFASNRLSQLTTFFVPNVTGG